MKTRTILVGLAALGAGTLGCWRLCQREPPVAAESATTLDAVDDGRTGSRRLSGAATPEEPDSLGIPAPQTGEMPDKDIEGGSPSPTSEEQIAEGASEIRRYYSTSASRWTRLNQLLNEAGEEELAEEIREMQMAFAMGLEQDDDPIAVAETLLERARGVLSGEEAEALFVRLQVAHEGLRDLEDSG